jgi:hypothetical protein
VKRIVDANNLGVQNEKLYLQITLLRVLGESGDESPGHRTGSLQ